MSAPELPPLSLAASPQSTGGAKRRSQDRWAVESRQDLVEAIGFPVGFSLKASSGRSIMRQRLDLSAVFVGPSPREWGLPLAERVAYTFSGPRVPGVCRMDHPQLRRSMSWIAAALLVPTVFPFSGAGAGESGKDKPKGPAKTE